MAGKSNTASRPKLACEVATDRVLAGRMSDWSSSVQCASYELPKGGLVADLAENNVRNPDAVYHTIRDSLDAVAGRSHDVIAVLPDSAVRVVLLDFDSLPSNRKEAEAVVRFRLKKSMPFDVEKARISYHAQRSSTGIRAVAAVALSSVVEEYEAAFHEAGYTPGIVLPSTLAALGGVQADRPTLVIKVDLNTTSIAILDQQQLLLFRTLENARGVAITGERLAEEIYPSLVFFQDTYHLNIDQILIAGIPDPEEAAPALGAQTGARVRDLISARLDENGGDVPRWRMSGVVGALVS